MSKPTTSIYLSFGIETVHSLARREIGESFCALLNGLPPLLTPTHYGFSDPIRTRLDIANAMEQLGGLWRDNGGDAHFAYRGKIKGYAHFNSQRGVGQSTNVIAFNLELVPVHKHGLEETCRRFLEGLVDLSNPTRGWMALSSGVRGGGWHDGYSPEVRVWNGVALSGGHIMTNLDCMPKHLEWINVLGREYVEHIGAERLLCLNVYRSSVDDAGNVWLQITERPEQMHLPETSRHVRSMLDRLAIAGAPPHHPEFDRSGIQIPTDTDPYSTASTNSSMVIGRTALSMSRGFGRQFPHRQDFLAVLRAMLKIAMRSKGPFSPFGVALAQDDELLHVRATRQKHRPAQEQAELVAERLALFHEQRGLKIAGACFYGKGPVPGQSEEQPAFKLHLESSEGQAFVVYLPFKEEKGKRKYGVLVVEPGDIIVFANAAAGS